MSNARTTFFYQNGSVNFPQPINEFNSLMMSFIFKSDIKSLQSVCDNWLNNPTNNELYYQPVLPVVMITYANNGGSYPTTPPYASWGVIPYREVIVSIFVVRVKKIGPVWISEYLSVIVPYIFVTDGIIMLNGRETFGMPKSFASIQLPDDPKASNKTFHLSALSAIKFQSQVPLTEIPIASIQQKSDGDQPTKTDWQDIGSAFDAIKNLIFGNGHIEIPGLNIMLEIAQLLIGEKLPFTALRQVRSISAPEETVYKAVVEFDAKVSKLIGGGLMQGTYELSLPENALYPIAGDLGLSDGQMADAAFWINWNFIFEAGKEIWRA